MLSVSVFTKPTLKTKIRRKLMFQRRFEWRKINVWKLVELSTLSVLNKNKLGAVKIVNKQQTIAFNVALLNTSRPVELGGPTYAIVIDLLIIQQGSKFKEEFWDKRSWVNNSFSTVFSLALCLWQIHSLWNVISGFCSRYAFKVYINPWFFFFFLSSLLSVAIFNWTRSRGKATLVHRG